jgi:hypothetical protein
MLLGNIYGVYGFFLKHIPYTLNYKKGRPGSSAASLIKNHGRLSPLSYHFF